MKARILALSLLVIATLLLPACGSFARAGKDLAVVATSPLTIPLAAVQESFDWGPETGDPIVLLLSPITVSGRIVKHALYTTVYAADLFFSPFYLLSSTDEDLAPIDIYSIDDGYPWKSQAVPYIED